MKHTQGPWENNGEGIICAHSGDVAVIVTDADGVAGGEMEGNAQLIAAAPELLAALEDLYSRCEKHFSSTGWPVSFHAGIGTSTLNKARAAIAKAKCQA